MAEPFIGEIRTFAFDRVPSGWAACKGQLLPINQFTSLFALIGTTYGGDGRSTFALPNLQGRVVVGSGPTPRDATRTLAEGGAASPDAAPKAPGADRGLGDAVLAASRQHFAQTMPTVSGSSNGRIAVHRPNGTPPRQLALNVCIALFGAFPGP
jgi:microcystin-dependent protein